METSCRHTHHDVFNSSSHRTMTFLCTCSSRFARLLNLSTFNSTCASRIRHCPNPNHSLQTIYSLSFLFITSFHYKSFYTRPLIRHSLSSTEQKFDYQKFKTLIYNAELVHIIPLLKEDIDSLLSMGCFCIYHPVYAELAFVKFKISGHNIEWLKCLKLVKT